MAKKPKTKKAAPPKPERTPTFVELTRDSIKAELDECIKRLNWQITQGGSYMNIHFLDTLRATEMGYRCYAAHLDACRSLKIQLGEERV